MTQVTTTEVQSILQRYNNNLKDTLQHIAYNSINYLKDPKQTSPITIPCYTSLEDLKTSRPYHITIPQTFQLSDIQITAPLILAIQNNYKYERIFKKAFDNAKKEAILSEKQIENIKQKCIQNSRTSPVHVKLLLTPLQLIQLLARSIVILKKI